MGEQDPELEQVRWEGLWGRLGARGSGVPGFKTLQAAYAEPTRFYHTAAHIRDCLTQLDRSRDLAGDPDPVEVAIWFHDAVYVPGAPDNEARSAQLAAAELTSGEVPLDTVRQVERLVLATRHQELHEDSETQLICDIDLSILGRDTSVYDEFERSIRREYAGVPEEMYRSGRSAILEAFLARPSIYATERFRSQYERQARVNLARSLSRLARAT